MARQLACQLLVTASRRSGTNLHQGAYIRRGCLQEDHMVRLIPVLLAFFFTSATLADDWKEYENRDYSFTVHFPGNPATETATYKAADGRSFPAHVFAVKRQSGTFKATVKNV
jgi:hypothetical protein